MSQKPLQSAIANGPDAVAVWASVPSTSTRQVTDPPCSPVVTSTKTDATNRVQLTIFAYEAGLVTA